MSAAASFRSYSLVHVLTPFHLKCARKGSFDLGDSSYIAQSCMLGGDDTLGLVGSMQIPRS